MSTIVDGEALFLDDGNEIRLIEIQASKFPLVCSGFWPGPLACRAKEVGANLAPVAWAPGVMAGVAPTVASAASTAAGYGVAVGLSSHGPMIEFTNPAHIELTDV